MPEDDEHMIRWKEKRNLDWLWKIPSPCLNIKILLQWFTALFLVECIWFMLIKLLEKKKQCTSILLSKINFTIQADIWSWYLMLFFQHEVTDKTRLDLIYGYIMQQGHTRAQILLLTLTIFVSLPHTHSQKDYYCAATANTEWQDITLPAGR